MVVDAAKGSTHPLEHIMSDPKPLDVHWAPADLNEPPADLKWWHVARDIFRAAGSVVDDEGGAPLPGGWTLGSQSGSWRPFGGTTRTETSATAAISAIVQSWCVTIIPSESRARILAWLDGTDKPTAPTPAMCTDAPPYCMGSTCVEACP